MEQLAIAFLIVFGNASLLIAITAPMLYCLVCGTYKAVQIRAMLRL